MRPDLASTLTGLCEEVIAAADAAPVAVTRVDMFLPMDFVLHRENGTATIISAPPDPVALRGLAVAPGRLRFSLAFGGADHVGD
jgi:hypothetical protein